MIRQAAVHLFSDLQLDSQASFKVVAKRSDKTFPYDSLAIQREVGGDILDAFPQLKVAMRQPDHKLVVSVQQDQAYLSLTSYPGMGGLPYGSSF